MKTGIVVSNYDPTYKGKIKVRVVGVHTEKVNGEYIILDDDLPWANPAPNGGGNVGSYAVPPVGAQVYVEMNDRYNIVYHNTVESKSAIKKMLDANAEICEKSKVIAFSEDNAAGSLNYMKIYYIPEKGLFIECDKNVIQMTKYDGVKVTSMGGSQIEMTPKGDINISTSGEINLNCKELNLVTSGASEKVVLGSNLINKFNNHTHYSGKYTTTEPITKLEESDFSDKVRIT